MELLTTIPKQLYHFILTLMLSSIPLTVLGQAGTRGWDVPDYDGGTMDDSVWWMLLIGLGVIIWVR